MGFFQTMATGYKSLWSSVKFGWQRHGAQILTSSGTGLMLVANGLMARKALKEDTRKAIDEANALIESIKNEQISAVEGKNDKNAKKKKIYKLAKARGKKLVTLGKHFWKESLVSAGGAVMIGTGQHMNTTQKTLLATGLAAYRANVVADQGPEKDLEYMGSKRIKGAKQVVLDDGTIVENTNPDGGELMVNADPNAFKFWFSPETCPRWYSDNLNMTIENLKYVENSIWMLGRMNGHVYLNDMRRWFAPLNTPHSLDHPLGGVFGKIFDKNLPNGCAKFELGGWRDDQDFMEGRKVGTWIFFKCDNEPIINKINQKLISVETAIT